MLLRNVVFKSIYFTKISTNCLKNWRSICVPSKKYLHADGTAGIIIIGDEILKGTTDVNTPFLIKQLNLLNLSVSKVTIIPDNIDAIANELSEFSSKCSFVITTGGIGPTHDDVTYEAAAKAFNDELQLNEELLNLFISYFGALSNKKPGILKYSRIPKTAIVNYVNINHNSKMIKYPIISTKNVFMFPGVPVILQKSFELLKSNFIFLRPPNFTWDIFISLDEFDLTSTLNEAVKKFNNVKFGSYPSFTNKYYKVKLTLESSCEAWIQKAYEFLSCELPADSILDIRKHSLPENDIPA